MAAPPGNCHNPNGRPRRLDTELARLETAAQHARSLLEQRYLADLLGNVEPCECTRRATAKSLDEIFEIERRLADLRELAEPLEAEPGRRRRRRHTPSGWEVDIARAAIALDRLMPSGEG